MKRQADAHAHSPEVRGQAEAVTRSLYGKNYRSEIAALYYWACDPRNVRYMRDPARVELVKDPHVIMATGQADCDEDVTLLGSFVTSRMAGLASASGNVEVEPVLAGFSRQDPHPTHTFVRVKDPHGTNRWIALDPVAGPLTGRMLRQVTFFQGTGVL